MRGVADGAEASVQMSPPRVKAIRFPSLVSEGEPSSNRPAVSRRSALPSGAAAQRSWSRAGPAAKTILPDGSPAEGRAAAEPVPIASVASNASRTMRRL